MSWSNYLLSNTLFQTEPLPIIATLNTLAMALAIPRGLVSPNVSALISNGSAILATLNAMRPMMR